MIIVQWKRPSDDLSGSFDKFTSRNNILESDLKTCGIKIQDNELV